MQKGKMNDWMATELFRILVVAIIFSPTVFLINMNNRYNKEIYTKQFIVRYIYQKCLVMKYHKKISLDMCNKSIM